MNLVKLVQFLRPELTVGPTDEADYTVISENGVATLEWHHNSNAPTSQELSDAENDLTTVNGQTFSQWLDEHGVDADKTRLRRARDYFAKTDDAMLETLIATVKALLVLINQLRVNASMTQVTLAQFKNSVKDELTP